MRPSDFRWWERWTTPTLLPSTGSPRLLDFSFPTRWLQSPRGAHRLHSSAASPMMAGFVQSGRLAAPTLCNEAESSSIALRLAGSPHRASPWGLLLSAPVWLHVGHLFDMLITFQINKEASLGLAHRITRILWISECTKQVWRLLPQPLHNPRNPRFNFCFWVYGKGSGQNARATVARAFRQPLRSLVIPPTRGRAGRSRSA